MSVFAALDYSFMRQALAGTALVGLLAGPTGYFLALRGQGFAGHALGHAGFAGAAASLCLGLPPFAGFLAAAALTGALIGLTDSTAASRDTAIGTILALMLGLGMLLLSYAPAGGGQATRLLFGNVFGITTTMLWQLAALAAVGLGGLALIGRGLVLASLLPALARARGLTLSWLGAAFLALAGLAIAAASQIVGALLVFSLSLAPGAAALLLARNVMSGLALATLFATLAGCGGVALAYATNAPPSFWIALLAALIYFAAAALARSRA